MKNKTTHQKKLLLQVLTIQVEKQRKKRNVYKILMHQSCHLQVTLGNNYLFIYFLLKNTS